MKYTICNLIVIFLGITLFCSFANADTVSLELKQLSEGSQFPNPQEDEDYLYRLTYPQRCMYPQQNNPANNNDTFLKTVKKEPKQYKSDYPFKSSFQLGDYEYIFVLDGSDIETKGYDTLHIDSNRNGDLTDDPVIDANEIPEGMRFGTGNAFRQFPMQTFSIQSGEQTFDYSFIFRIQSYYDPNNNQIRHAYASVNAASYREGEITLNNQKHKLVLIDFNSNGRFDDAPSIDENISKQINRFYTLPTDIVLIDPNPENKRFYGYSFTGRDERHPVSKLICIDDSFFELSVTPSGDKLSITPTTKELGKITNPNDNFSVVVFGDNGFVKISGNASEPVTLPEGDWRLVEYKIETTESNTEKPTLVSAYATPKYPKVTVQNGKTVTLPFGPPYHPKVTMNSLGGMHNVNRVRLSMQLIGSAGEQCNNLLVEGERPPDPSFVIATPSGEIVQRGNFEYG